MILAQLYKLDTEIHVEQEKIRNQFVTWKIDDLEFHKKTDELIKEYIRRSSLIIKSK